MVRILHVGLGPLGRRILEDFHTRKMGEVIGAVDLSPELAGRELRSVIPGAPDGVTITADLETAARLDFDACLVTTSSDLERCADTFRVLLDRGHAVISSCEELLYPWLRHPILAQELHQRAVKKGGRLLGTGINPGFLMDTLPVVATSVCNRVDRISIERIQDATPRRIPFQQKIGATLDADAFKAKEKEGTLRHVGLLESLHFVAHYLGWKLDEWSESLEPVLATHEMECGLGKIAKGAAAGVRQVAIGRVAGDSAEAPALTLTFQAAIGQVDPHDSVHVEGDPPVDLVVRGGVHGDVGTSAILLNSIDPLRRGEPALHTMATLPPTPYRLQKR